MKAVNMIRGLGQAIFGCSGDNSQSVHALWIIALAYSLPLGVQAGWGAVLAINLKKVAGIGSVMSGWIGCISTLSGCIGGSELNPQHFLTNFNSANVFVSWR